MTKEYIESWMPHPLTKLPKEEDKILNKLIQLNDLNKEEIFNTLNHNIDFEPVTTKKEKKFYSEIYKSIIADIMKWNYDTLEELKLEIQDAEILDDFYLRKEIWNAYMCAKKISKKITLQEICDLIF